MSSPLDPVDLMGSILEKEKKSKELRDAPFSPNIASELHELLHRIRKEYRLLIVEFPGFNPEKKDVMGLFWKNCFYKHIEEFRKSIKKLKGQLDVNRFNQKLANHMSRLCQEFIAFLSDSAKFIQKLMADLERKTVEVISKVDKDYYDHLVNGVYRCLLYLGDLARYKELYSEQEHKDFTESVRYYERAALLMPSSGNPHNQLAMLATYNEAESTALYHYCRSVLTQNPFSGGFENLARLFALNKHSYDTLYQQIHAQSSTNQSSLNYPRQHSHQQNRKVNEQLKFKFLLTSFVRLHGLLFAWTIRMHMEYLQTAEGMSQESIESSTLLVLMNDSLTKTILGNKTDVDYEEIQELIFSILQEFDDVIYTSKLTDLHLLRLITISMFSVHFAEMPSAGLFNDANFSTFLQHHTCSTPSVQSPISFSHPIAHRTIIQSLSLSAIYAIVTRAAIKLSNQLQSNLSDNGPKKVFMEKVMPMLTVFSEWLVNHPSLLQPAKEIESRASDPINPPSVFLEMNEGSAGRISAELWRGRYCVRRESARLEARARSSMRSALSILKEVWEKDVMQLSRDVVATAEGSAPTVLLREHAELRGYLPLNDQLERYFLHFDPLRKTINWMTDAKARALRQEIILDFISQVLLAESKEIESSPLAQGHLLTPSNLNRKETREHLKGRKTNLKHSVTPLTAQKKKPQEDKGKKKKNGQQERSPSRLKGGNESEEVENADEEKIRLAERDFPSLPGGITSSTNQANDFWKGLKASVEKPVDEKVAEFEIVEKDLDERWINGVTDEVDNEVFEDFEDVVFQPSFKRFVDETPSPFANAPVSSTALPLQNDSNPFLLGAENLSFTSSPTVSALLGQQEQQDDIVANDILTSLGISKNKSSSQLSDGGKLPLPVITSTSNDLWEKLGVSGVDGSNLPSHHSFSADWNDVLTETGLSTNWENPYHLDRAHAANSTLLFPSSEVSTYVPAPPPPGISTLHSSPVHSTPFHLPTTNIAISSPPGLIPSKTSSPAVPTAPPPGLLRSVEVRESIGKISDPPLPRSNDFLSYLNASTKSSWKT